MSTKAAPAREKPLKNKRFDKINSLMIFALSEILFYRLLWTDLKGKIKTLNSMLI